MSAEPSAPISVDALYEELARERAAETQAIIAAERRREWMFGTMAAVLEDAAGVLLHAAETFADIDGRMPQWFARHATALLTAAGRFQQAADLIRAEQGGD